MKNRPLTRKELKYFSRMAAEAYVNDPVHSYVTKSEKLRKRFVYHFMMLRLSTSNREDIIHIDEEKRGICVWRDAYNEYDFFDFIICPNWVFMFYLYMPKLIKTLMAYGHLDVKVFPEKTKIISPVFVSPEHQGKGIATKLIKKGIEELVPQGYRLGLEAQDEKNREFYEKLGFRVLRHDYWKREKINNYYMIYEPDEE